MTCSGLDKFRQCQLEIGGPLTHCTFFLIQNRKMQTKPKKLCHLPKINKYYHFVTEGRKEGRRKGEKLGQRESYFWLVHKEDKSLSHS